MVIRAGHSRFVPFKSAIELVRKASMDILEWLRGLGLDQYAPAFHANRITPDLLPSLTAEDLRELGVGPVGDRRRRLGAIAALAPAPTAEPEPAAPEACARQEAERRQLTVMFCDLVGSTALSTRLDPEDMRERIGAYHRCCAGRDRPAPAVSSPSTWATACSPISAIRTPTSMTPSAPSGPGLQLVEAVADSRRPPTLPLQVRVGIATGLVVVGDLIGEGAAQEEAVVGETPNLAARLQALAEPGAVVIGRAHVGSIGGLFDYRDLGRVALKGFAETVRAWQVLGASAAESRFEALRAGAT